MREKYESLSAVVLRDLAKVERHSKISPDMKKSDLVDLMVAEDEQAGQRREYEAA